MLGVALISAPQIMAEESPNANAGTKRIVVLGDSITAGYGLGPEDAYPALLQAKIDAAGLDYTVTNAGVSGDTTAGGLRRVAWSMSKGADIMIIALGGNDGLRGISPEDTKKISSASPKKPAPRTLRSTSSSPACKWPTTWGRNSPLASKPFSRRLPKNQKRPSSPSSSKALAAWKTSINPTASTRLKRVKK